MKHRVDAIGSPALERLLQNHPGVDLQGCRTGSLNIAFNKGDWPRRVRVAVPDIEPTTGPLYGLVELMDNNPLVCADQASCPGQAATLALIAVGPLAKASLLSEAPALLFSFTTGFSEVEDALSQVGWSGVNATYEPADLGSVLSLTCLASIPTSSLPDIEAVYDECYGRSFFVHKFTSGSWSSDLVQGKHHAEFRIEPSPSDEERSVLRVDVLADKDGKCGASQIVHMFNVMAGYEEDLGLTD